MISRFGEILHRIWRGGVVFIFSASFALLLGTLDGVKKMESRLLDKRFQWRANSRYLSHKLTYIGIGAEDEKNLGKWPWPGALHAQLLAGFTNETLQPAAIAFDPLLNFPPQDDVEKQGEQQFAGLLKGLGNVCVGGVASTRPPMKEEDVSWLRSQVIPPLKDGKSYRPDHSIGWVPEPIRTYAHLGLLNVPPDSDGMIRSFPLLYREGDHWIPSFALQTVMLYNEVHLDEVRIRPGHYIRLKPPNGIDIGKGVRVPELRIPVDQGLRFRINYRGKLADFSHVSFQEALDWASRKSDNETVEKILASSNQGVVVICKTTFDREMGMVPTPLEAAPPLAAAQLNAINNLMTGDFLRTLPGWTESLLLFILCALGTWITQRLAWDRASAVMAALLFGYLGISLALFNFASVWLPWVVPITGLMVTGLGGMIWKSVRQREKTVPDFVQISPEMEKPGPVFELSLEEILARQGAVPVPLAFFWLKHATFGLQNLHENSMLCHHLSPENMRVDATAALTIKELGMDGSGGGTSKGLSENGALSKAEFMSPEQVKNETVDHRADFYSLGIIFFKMLSGELPFHHDSPGGICMGHLQKPIPPLLSPPTDFSQALDELIGKMAAKEREKRFQDANELLKAIEPWIEANPLDANAHQYFNGLGLESRQPAAEFPVSNANSMG